ncbi:MAG: hypothetical protein C0484_28080 [Rhodospirillum sp.]|nr:hypothetical protein [Rhodospirillum sp.]
MGRRATVMAGIEIGTTETGIATAADHSIAPDHILKIRTRGIASRLFLWQQAAHHSGASA